MSIEYWLNFFKNLLSVFFFFLINNNGLHRSRLWRFKWTLLLFHYQLWFHIPWTHRRIDSVPKRSQALQQKWTKSCRLQRVVNGSRIKSGEWWIPLPSLANATQILHRATQVRKKSKDSRLGTKTKSRIFQKTNFYFNNNLIK